MSFLTQPIFVCWTPPIAPFFKLNVDGLGAGSPRKVGAGGVIRNIDGQFVAGFSVHLGDASTNFSELWAIWNGIHMAINMGIENLDAESDSHFVVQALTTDTPINQYFSQVQAMLVDCRSAIEGRNFKITKIFREQNKAADHLAREAAINRMDIDAIVEPSTELMMIMHQDNQRQFTAPRLP